MELGLSLGEAQKPFSFMQKTIKTNQRLGFCMGLGFESTKTIQEEEEEEDVEKREETDERDSADPPVQLALLPLLPATRHPSSHRHFPWSAGHESGASGRGFDVNRIPSADEFNDGAPASSPNSVSSMQVDFSIYRGGGKRDRDAAGIEIETERASSRASDEEENGMARKKLRLSKEQSAFLEESFKEHNTLNPKQKLALAKQLNLRPRQVEVWFQNRRARTKLKQTEVDCEYLKRCCETLTEENRRLQKELQELRALKTSNPFYTRLPATTLTMCPSCERVISTSNGADASTITAGFGTPSKHRSFPFSQHHQPAAS